MKEQNKRLLIFDCDGVLIDSEPLCNKIFVECLQQEGFAVDEVYGKRFHGIALQDCLQIIKDDFKKDVSDSFTVNLNGMIHEEMKRSLQAIQGIKEALDQLPQPKCVASGSDHERLRLSLGVTGLLPYFNHIYSATDVPRGKPFPDVFLLAAESLQYAPDNCIVIEDSYPGMQAGLAAGMQVLLYNPIWKDEHDIPHHVTVFNNMAELPMLVNG